MAVELYLLQLLQLLQLVISCSSARSGPPALLPLPSHCYCNRIVPQENAPSVMRVDKRVGQFATLHCCAQEVAPDHVNATVTWTYNGKPFPWSRVDSQFGDEGCFPQEVGARYVVPRDRGNYTCTYTLPGGSTVSRTIVLVVHKSAGRLPLIAAISNDTLARVGDQVTLFCTAYTGGQRVLWGPSSVGWWVYRDNGSMVPAELVPGITVQLSSKSEDGMYTTILHIASMSTAMYGVYTCMATNLHNYTLSNVTLLRGVPPTVALAETYQTATMVVVVCVVVVVVIVVVAFRLRLTIALALRSDAKDPDGDYTNDAFIVHGETCTDWVMQELVWRLEEVHHYTCCLPARDLQGGAALVDELPRQLGRSRRVVVVVTSCLVRCPWSLWCIELAVHAALSRGTGVVALMLQNLEDLEETPTSARLVSRINLIKKIWHPSCSVPKHPSCKVPKNRNKKSLSDTEDNEISRVSEAIKDTTHSPETLDVKKLCPQPPHGVPYKFDPSEVPPSPSMYLAPVPQLPQPTSDNHLDKQGTKILPAAKKTKSDLYLNFPDADVDAGVRSLSLQHQRLQNMVSSTQRLGGLGGDCFRGSSLGVSTEEYPGLLNCKLQQESSGCPLTQQPWPNSCRYLAMDPSSPPDTGAASAGPARKARSTFTMKFCAKLNLNSPQFNATNMAPTDNQLVEGPVPPPRPPISGGSNQLTDNNSNTIRLAPASTGFGVGYQDSHSGGGGRYSEAVAPYKPPFQRSGSQEEGAEPDTPCSATPFIMPDGGEVERMSRVRKKDATVLGALWLCCSSLFTQTPQQRFWQRLLLQLPALPLARVSAGGEAPQ